MSSSGRARNSLYVGGATVVAVGADDVPAGTVVDAGGLVVLSGIDTHVHLIDPGDTTREDFPTGSAAAGVTSIIEHTPTHGRCPVRDLEEKRAHVSGRSNVDFGPDGPLPPRTRRHHHLMTSGGVDMWGDFLRARPT